MQQEKASSLVGRAAVGSFTSNKDMVPQISAAGTQELGDNQKSIVPGICLPFTLSSIFEEIKTALRMNLYVNKPRRG